jgi:hypothetical protein
MLWLLCKGYSNLCKKYLELILIIAAEPSYLIDWGIITYTLARGLANLIIRRRRAREQREADEALQRHQERQPINRERDA